MDILASEDEREQVLAFVARAGGARCSGGARTCSPSAPGSAMRAKPGRTRPSGRPAASNRSNATSPTRSTRRGACGSSCSTPSASACRLAAEHLAATRGRLELLAGDVRMLDDVDRQLEQYGARHAARRSRCAWRRSTRSCSRWSGAVTRSSTRRCASAACSTSSTSRACRRASSARSSPTRPAAIERRVNELIDWLVEVELPAVAGGHHPPGRAPAPAPRPASSASRRPADSSPNAHG